MELITIALELVVITISENKEVPDVDSAPNNFVSDSVRWIYTWLERGEYVGLITKLEEEPDSPNLREELRLAMIKRAEAVTRFTQELEWWIKESKKPNPKIRMTQSGVLIFEDTNIKAQRDNISKDIISKGNIQIGSNYNLGDFGIVGSDGPEGSNKSRSIIKMQGNRIEDQQRESVDSLTTGNGLKTNSKSKNIGEQSNAKKFTTIDVFYATDRKKTGHSKPTKKYGGERNNLADSNQEPLQYGICKVSIPSNHEVGKIEAPKWWKFEFTSNPEKHIVLKKVQESSKDTFFHEMNVAIQSRKKEEAFVFVHGYNVTFAEAAKRTAQIAFDLNFNGAPIMYSWPSNGLMASYTMDEANIEWTQPHLQNFLNDIMHKSTAKTIHLIAHSMGNRALTRAFADLSNNHKKVVSKKFKKVILTAPDIDADVFKNQIAPAMLKSKSHITLYASSNDLALIASKKVHGYPRAGDSGEKLLVLKGIETIDASDVNTGLLGHSYFAESLDIITDIFKIIHEGVQASERKDLTIKSDDRGDYWIVPGKTV
ncbi:alpha/beta hydrolase [Muriicola sp. Z0-33]|uniref:alpha/beta hydrolase n=1 Tax=Muriicola sp. Z0-33 TaxID=2816957 RepID=UPI0022387215|nr:alpha/beta hydrolase [Muriicola sp. Z0-33]MCW5516166.1 alpha/beta hydrolase [Muriicola sp. Z0-33]